MVNFSVKITGGFFSSVPRTVGNTPQQMTLEGFIKVWTNSIKSFWPQGLQYDQRIFFCFLTARKQINLFDLVELIQNVP